VIIAHWAPRKIREKASDPFCKDCSGYILNVKEEKLGLWLSADGGVPLSFLKAAYCFIVA